LIHLAILDIRLENDDDPSDLSGLELCEEIDPLVAKILVTAYPPAGVAVGIYADKIQIPFGDRQLEVHVITKQDSPRLVLKAIAKSLQDQFEIIPRRRIAVLTSGGDSPGMNAAIRSIVRVALDNEVEVIGVQDGYQGLVEDHTYKLTWNFVSDILVQGGTILGTARFPGFSKRAVREKAVENIMRKQISGLVVIGGDGSMKGARVLAQDLEDLGSQFQTVTIPGTIDNDLWGTDMSLGAASAANAMIDQLRDMIRPAQALRRIYVCEVMGRYCGYLALQAALGIGADAVIIPEKVVEVDPAVAANAPEKWMDRVKSIETEDRFREYLDRVASVLEAAFAAGKQYGFVVMGEGIGQLTDDLLNMHYVRRYLEDRIKRWSVAVPPDVRAHILGYPVRVEPPCHYDIWLGTVTGAAAVQCLLAEKSDVMVGWTERDGITTRSLEQVVQMSNRPPHETWLDRPGWHELLELQEALASPPALQQQLRDRGNRFV
jgi:6-phosphofructokinase 1